MNAIHPTAVLDGDVQIGVNNSIGPYVTINGPAIIGNGNYLGPGVSIGSVSRERLDPSHRLADPLPPESSAVVIGSNCMIFDHAVISKPMFEETRVGNHVEIGAQTMIGHDCAIRDHVIISPHVALGAYVTVGVRANLGLSSTVHNRLTVGGLAMCGMASVIVGNVPAGALVHGNPARIRGANTVGLIRAGFLKRESEAMLASLNGDTVELKDSLRQLVEQYLLDVRRWPTTKKEVQWGTRNSSSSQGYDPSM
jgi:UDP-N-acetylglucosamine acyltransferase